MNKPKTREELAEIRTCRVYSVCGLLGRIGVSAIANRRVMSVFTLYEAGERIMPGKGGVCSAVCPRHHCPVCEQRGITPKGTRGDRRYMCVGSCDLKWNPNQQYLLVEMYRDEPGIKDRIKKTND